MFEEDMAEPTTEVTIIGTFHGALKVMKHYSPDILLELIEKSQPQVIATEIRPQDFSRGETKNNPWDINEVIIPYCQKNKIEIGPIDWWPDDIRAGEKAYFENLSKSAAGQNIINEISDEWAPHSTDFPSFKNATPEYIHSELFAQRDSDYRTKVKSLIGEGPQNLWWYTRADKINENIEGVLKTHSGKRITIIVGASHRPDIESFLKTQSNVIIKQLF